MSPIIPLLVCVVTICSAQTNPTSNPVATQDHLLSVLQSMHKSDAFHHLPSAEKVILVELLAAAEVDQVTHYIDQLGFARILVFLDHVTRINSREAHLLEHYLKQELDQENHEVPGGGNPVIGRKRDLPAVLAAIPKLSTYQNLTTSEKNLLEELARAAESGGLTAVVHREGYSKIIQLVEGINIHTIDIKLNVILLNVSTGYIQLLVDGY